MARMELDPRSDYMLSEDGTTLYIRLTQVYDKYTKYRKDYAIMGEVLPYAQFKKQLTHSDLLIQSNAQKRIGQNSVKCWIIDFSATMRRIRLYYHRCSTADLIFICYLLPRD